MIAGLRQRTDVGDFNGIPLLKDVRVLGPLFRSRETQVKESELVVFLTPEIVGYNDCLDERDYLTADTIRCRLDRIPPGEGCPQCNGTGGCDCGEPKAACQPVIVGDTPPNSLSPSGFPVLIEPTDTPPRQEDLPTPAPAAIEPIDIVQPFDLSFSERSSPQADLRKSVRRLPPAARVAVAYATPAAANKPKPQVNEKPMRIDYDARYRAPGSANANRERFLSDPASTEDKPEEKKSSWKFWQ
jgi:hypothetical protein